MWNPKWDLQGYIWWRLPQNTLSETKKIYTPKSDDEHHRPLSYESPSPPPPTQPFLMWLCRPASQTFSVCIEDFGQFEH